MKKIEKTILSILDTISVMGFAVTALLSSYKNAVPGWLPLLFAVCALIFSIIGMLDKKSFDTEPEI